MKSKVVTVVKSKAPCYAFDSLIVKKFREANSIYQKIPGLEFKAYTINRDTSQKNIGGIYLWKDEQSAKNWYTTKWFEEVKKKRGVSPILEYYNTICIMSYLPNNMDYSKIATGNIAIFIHSLTMDLAINLSHKIEGLFRAYLLAEKHDNYGLILFFESSDIAKSFIKTNKINNEEWFKVPVILNNNI